MADKTTTEHSVEDCLKELRKMFPRQSLRLEFQVTASGKLSVFFISNDLEVIGAESLRGTMDLVRQWHAEQGKESKG